MNEKKIPYEVEKFSFGFFFLREIMLVILYSNELNLTVIFESLLLRCVITLDVLCYCGGLVTFLLVFTDFLHSLLCLEVARENFIIFPS